MEPEETNQRMVALQGEAQRAPTSLVTCSSLAGSLVWGEGWDKWRKEGRMGGSNDVRSDLWKDEMIRDQRAGEGWKGAGEGWNNAPMGGHMEGEVNGERDERKRGEEWAAVWAGGCGGGDGGGGGCISWKILLQWLECRTGALIYNVYHGSVRDFNTYKMEQHQEVSRCHGTAENRPWGQFQYSVLFVLAYC